MYNYEHFEIGNHFCEYAGMQFSLKETSKICTDDILMCFFLFFIENKFWHFMYVNRLLGRGFIGNNLTYFWYKNKKK